MTTMDSPLPDTAAEAADSQPATDGPMGLAAVLGSPSMDDKMECGHLRQFGTCGEVFPVFCLACDNERLRQKLRETKKYLRAANRGAERNAIVSQLLTARHAKLWQEFDAFRKANAKGEARADTATPPKSPTQ